MCIRSLCKSVLHQQSPAVAPSQRIRGSKSVAIVVEDETVFSIQCLWGHDSVSCFFLKSNLMQQPSSKSSFTSDCRLHHYSAARRAPEEVERRIFFFGSSAKGVGPMDGLWRTATWDGVYTLYESFLPGDLESLQILSSPPTRLHLTGFLFNFEKNHPKHPQNPPNLSPPMSAAEFTHPTPAGGPCGFRPRRTATQRLRAAKTKLQRCVELWTTCPFGIQVPSQVFGVGTWILRFGKIV